MQTSDNLRFVGGQPEKGEESERNNFQGYSEFKNKLSAEHASEHLRIPWAKKCEAPTYSLFIEPRSGNQEQASQYIRSEFFCRTHNCGSSKIEADTRGAGEQPETRAPGAGRTRGAGTEDLAGVGAGRAGTREQSRQYAKC